VVRCSGSQFDPDVVRAFLAVSTPRLRRALGPASWIGQLPVVGTAPAGGFPAVATTVARGAGTVVLGGVASAVVVGTTGGVGVADVSASSHASQHDAAAGHGGGWVGTAPQVVVTGPNTAVASSPTPPTSPQVAPQSLIPTPRPPGDGAAPGPTPSQVLVAAPPTAAPGGQPPASAPSAAPPSGASGLAGTLQQVTSGVGGTVGGVVNGVGGTVGGVVNGVGGTVDGLLGGGSTAPPTTSPSTSPSPAPTTSGSGGSGGLGGLLGKLLGG
jgi:hypothetical protein